MIVIISRFLVPKGFIGITLFPFIFLRKNEMKNNRVLVQHERIHIRQQLELLLIPFFIWYGIEFLCRWMQVKNRKKAYQNISFEREAYAFEHDFTYLKKRRFFAFLSFL